MRRSRSLAAVSTSLMVIGACTTASTTTSTTFAPPTSGGVAQHTETNQRAVAEDAEIDYVIDWYYLPFEDQVAIAPAIVTANVVKDTGPFWNQTNGQRWSVTQSRNVPYLYRALTVEVSTTIRDELGLPDRFEVRYILSGVRPAQDYRRFHGERLLLLRLGGFPMRECDVLAYQPLAQSALSIFPSVWVELLPTSAWGSRDATHPANRAYEGELLGHAGVEAGDCVG